MAMQYRADIDGLRALAVAPVVLYHAHVPGFSGGFAGVDVFFVISGFLICGLIAADLRNGSFSLAEFYKRRALRILPALFAMLLVVSMLAYKYYLPVELEQYARSLASTVASVSNVYFAMTTGYFDAPAETKPLLHTWSLGVEEQFYLLVPLLLLLLHRYLPRRVGLFVTLGVVLSYASAVLISYRNTEFEFYLTPFRAWELGLGAMLALGVVPTPDSRAGRNLIGIAGLGMIAGVVCLGSSATPLLLVTSLASAGTVLVIASSMQERSAVGSLLAWRPFVLLGVISYSVYLWHWPVLVFTRADDAGADGLSHLKTAIVVLLPVLLGWLSWRLIETNYRSIGPRVSPRAVFAVTTGTTAVYWTACAAALLLAGLPARFPDRVVGVASWLGYDASEAFRSGRCYLATNRQRLDVSSCMTSNPGQSNYLLVGDSHAAHLWLGLSSSLPEINFMQATASDCRPALGKVSPLDTRACPRLMHFVFDDFLARNRVDRVLLAAAWKEEDLSGLSETLRLLRARNLAVTVFGPIAEYQRALPRLIAEGMMRGDPGMAGAHLAPGILERDRRMARLVAEYGAKYVSVYDALCRSGRCDTFVDADTPMQFDAGHLTARGSIELGRRLRPALIDMFAKVQADGK